jgi:hypothetical protein
VERQCELSAQDTLSNCKWLDICILRTLQVDHKSKLAPLIDSSIKVNAIVAHIVDIDTH